jgi:tetratricopeptide (TPR) repeat protein
MNQVFSIWRLRFAICSLQLLAAAAAHAETNDQRFLEGLRQRRLFSLAEAYCLQRLSDADLSEERRAELTVELSRAYSEHALNATPAGAEPLWSQAVEVTHDFARQYPQSTWLVLVKTQAGLVLLNRGEFFRQQSEITADPQKLQEEARGTLRLAVRQLGQVDEEIAGRLSAPPRPGQATQLSRDQLLSLQRHVRHELARAYRNLGQTQPVGSPDRSDALTQALERLRTLSQLPTTDPLGWQARLEEIACARLLQDYATASRRLEALVELPDPPPVVALKARAEHIRLALAAEQTGTALAVTRAGRVIDGATHPELDLAWLEAYLAAAHEATDAQDAAAAKQWQSQASTLLAEIQRQHGPYWTRRAEGLLAGHVTVSAPSTELDVLVRAAEAFYRNGQISDAVAAYDRIAAQADARGNPGQAFQIRYTAASIYHEQKDHRAAADRFRQLALAAPKHEKAGEAHLLAIYNAAQEARRQEPISLEEYRQLLDEHLQHWPSGPSADQAYRMLARLREHEGDWPAAIGAYGRISPADPQYAAAIEAMAGCYERWFVQLRAAGKPVEEPIAAAARQFESIVGASGRLPERWSAVERVAASSAARFYLAGSPPDYRRAEQVLTPALADPGADAAWSSTAASLLVSALAGQGRFDEARRKLEGISAGSPTALIALLEQLSQLAESASAETGRTLAELQLDAIERIGPRRHALDAQARRSLDRIHGQALAAAGRREEALGLVERLAGENPRDGQIQEDYARLLSESADRPSLEAALARWRELEQKSKPATPRWFRAKYHLAWAHERLGNKDHAAKIITLTKVLHPELGGPELKARFEALLARCQ